MTILDDLCVAYDILVTDGWHKGGLISSLTDDDTTAPVCIIAAIALADVANSPENWSYYLELDQQTMRIKMLNGEYSTGDLHDMCQAGEWINSWFHWGYSRTPEPRYPETAPGENDMVYWDIWEWQDSKTRGHFGLPTQARHVLHCLEEAICVRAIEEGENQ